MKGRDHTPHPVPDLWERLDLLTTSRAGESSPPGRSNAPIGTEDPTPSATEPDMVIVVLFRIGVCLGIGIGSSDSKLLDWLCYLSLVTRLCKECEIYRYLPVDVNSIVHLVKRRTL